MLLKSIIRKTLGIKDHVVRRVREEGRSLIVELDRHKGRLLSCSRCGKRHRMRDRLGVRQWRHVPLWGIPVFLEYAPARVKCPTHGKVVVEAMPWSAGKTPLSVGLIGLLSTWAKMLAWDVVARLFDVHWNTVAGAVRQAVGYGLAHRKMGDVLYIGVDELSRRKGHVYVTNVYDLAGRRLLWSGEGRGIETMEIFFKEYGEALQDKVIGVCCDMWEPYIETIRKHLPNATLVFDKFHIIRKLLEAVDQVRREEASQLRKTNPGLLKRTRYLFLKNPENLTDQQRARLGYLEKMNLRCNRAYLLKEAFREFWTYTTKGWARKFLKKWFRWATHSRLKPIRDFA